MGIRDGAKVGFGSGPWDALWFEPQVARNFLMYVGQFMGTEPSQNREDNRDLRLVVNSGYGY